MTVVKFSILTLLAGGFCTLLGIGMWMGPQDTPCSAQTGTKAVAAAHSPAPCWSLPPSETTHLAVVATEVKRCEGDGEGSACAASVCSGDVCPSESCESGACDLVATPAPAEPTACATSAPIQAFVPRLPEAPCAPGAPCPPPSYAPVPTFHVAPYMGPECPPPAYSNSYAAVPATLYPAPVVSTYAAYGQVEPRDCDQPSMEMIEAFMEEREQRHEDQIKALKEQMELQAQLLEAHLELKLETREATLTAKHQVEMSKLQAEAMVKFASMEQALREEKALLQLVADGTLPTESLRAILARNHANGHGATVQHVSAVARCACEKCACESCKCGKADASCVCADCECEGCACPGCEQAVSTAAPACTPCEEAACNTSACETKTCETSACGKSGNCKSGDACATCPKDCDGCTPAPNSLELIVTACEGEGCKILADGVPVAILDGCTLTAQGLECIGVSQDREGGCKIMFGQKAAACAKGECKACPIAECPAGKCGTCDKPVAVETANSPFVCEKDGCEVEFRFDDVPVLSNIPYVGRLFHNVRRFEDTSEEAAPVEEAQR